MLQSVFLKIAAFSLLLVTLGLVAHHYFIPVKADSSRTDWEYLIVSGGRVSLQSNSGSMSKLKLDSGFREFFPLEKNFDRLGTEGWELVSVIPGQPESTYFFKRPKQN